MKVRIAFDGTSNRDFQSYFQQLLETVGPRPVLIVPGASPVPAAAEDLKAVAYDVDDSRPDLLRGTVEFAVPMYVCRPEEGLPLLMAVATYGSVYRFIREYQVLDVELPERYIDRAFSGPRYGAQAFFPADDSRMYRLGLILKPRFALPLDSASQHAFDFAVGGVDYIADDELTVATDSVDFGARVEAVEGALHRAASVTGKKIPYIVNITSRSRRALQLARTANDTGVAAVMVNTITMGYDVVSELARSSTFTGAIVANGIGRGIVSNGPAFRVSEPLLCKLARWAGADAVYTGTFAGHIVNARERAAQYVSALSGEGFSRKTRKSAAAVMSGGIYAPELIANTELYGDHLMLSIGNNFCSAYAEGIPPRALIEVLHLIKSAWDRHGPSRGQEIRREVLDIGKRGSQYRDAMRAFRVSDLEASG